MTPEERFRRNFGYFLIVVGAGIPIFVVLVMGAIASLAVVIDWWSK